MCNLQFQLVWLILEQIWPEIPKHLERLCTNTLSQLKTYVAKFVYIFVMQIYYTFVISLDHGGPCHLSHDLGYWDKIPAENCSNKCLNRHLKLYFDYGLSTRRSVLWRLWPCAMWPSDTSSSQKVGKNSEANFISYFVKDFWLIQTAVSF